MFWQFRLASSALTHLWQYCKGQRGKTIMHRVRSCKLELFGHIYCLLDSKMLRVYFWNGEWSQLQGTTKEVLGHGHTDVVRYCNRQKGKGRYSSSWESHHRAMGCHLPYGITQCYLPPDTSEWALPDPSHAGLYLIYLPRRDGRLSWPWLC